MIREMVMADVTEVVTIHISSFPGFFLTFLGENFLRIYYESVLEQEDRIAFISFSETAQIEGFVVGSANPRGFYSRLLAKKWYKFALASIVPALKKPRIIIRLLRALAYPAANPAGENMCGLYSVCVNPTTQSRGIGQQLVERFLQDAKAKSCQEVFLTTDKLNNQNVNCFYQKLGFQVEKEYTTPEGRQMLYYVKRI